MKKFLQAAVLIILAPLNLMSQTDSLVRLAELTDFPKSGFVSDAFVKNNLLYVCGYDGSTNGYLRVYDISNPSAPSYQGSVSAAGKEVSVMLNENNTVYMLGSDGLFVADISNPAAPSKVTEHNCITVGSNSRCFRDGYSNIAKDGNRLIVNRSLWGLNIFDISSIQSPVYLGGFEFGFNTVRDYMTLGANKLLLNDESGLRTVDYSNTASLVVMPTSDAQYVNLPGTTEGWLPTSDKNTVYVYSWGASTSSLSIVDVPSRTIIGGFNLKPYSSLGGRMRFNNAGTKIFVSEVELDLAGRTNISFRRYNPFTLVLTTTANNTITRKGNYTVWIMGSGGVTGTAAHKVEKLSLYPNPAGNTLHLGLLPVNAAITICNSTGAIVHEYKVLANGDVDVSKLESGVYHVMVQTGEQTQRATFIRE